jgi:hypothetical protein
VCLVRGAWYGFRYYPVVRPAATRFMSVPLLGHALQGEGRIERGLPRHKKLQTQGALCAGFEPTAIRFKALKRFHWPRTLRSCVHRYSMCIKYFARAETSEATCFSSNAMRLPKFHSPVHLMALYLRAPGSRYFRTCSGGEGRMCVRSCVRRGGGGGVRLAGAQNIPCASPQQFVQARIGGTTATHRCQTSVRTYV